ncbi:hypothetical protein D3C81_1907930 [compost metagenome]
MPQIFIDDSLPLCRQVLLYGNQRLNLLYKRIARTCEHRQIEQDVYGTENGSQYGSLALILVVAINGLLHIQCYVRRACRNGNQRCRPPQGRKATGYPCQYMQVGSPHLDPDFIVGAQQFVRPYEHLLVQLVTQ